MGVATVKSPAMTPRTANATAGWPNRILLALAAAWVIASLAIGGTVVADPGTDRASPTRATAERASQR
jgi:hypothetical protein